jgi:ketosteroid isomerase-like protein
MSQANVEIVKEAIDAVNRRDIDAFSQLGTADCEWFPAVIGSVEPTTFCGREGMETYLATIPETWDEIRVVIEGLRDLDDRVLAHVRLETRGRGSGVPTSASQWVLYDFRDGKISRLRGYLDHGEALRAAGLAE